MKIGDIVALKVTTEKKIKIVHFDYEGKTEIKLFEIIGKCPAYESFLVTIPDNMTGWMISQFYVENCHVSEKFLGKKFWEINETFTKSFKEEIDDVVIESKRTKQLEEKKDVEPI